MQQPYIGKFLNIGLASQYFSVDFSHGNCLASYIITTKCQTMQGSFPLLYFHLSSQRQFLGVVAVVCSLFPRKFCEQTLRLAGEVLPNIRSLPESFLGKAVLCTCFRMPLEMRD